ncbi:MAG: hypothetical protein JXQ83_13235, partial [Candidatus Glassbacteria bacterium]|nr:hypothetical protein [Candidatus Glassbacteria bacterium]
MSATARFIYRIAVILLLALVIVGMKFLAGAGGSAPGGDPQAATHVFDSFTMGTILTVKVRTGDRALAEKAAGLVFDEVARV